MAVRNNTKRRGAGTSSLATPAQARGTGSVRIVSGIWRRSVIPVAQADGLRPTSERVRETVFDWLVHLFGTLEGRAVLDMFAGSGAMGFEAASRGASKVDWLDINRTGIAGIRSALARLKAPEGMTAHVTDAFVFLKQTETVYDLIVIDPPFSAELQAKAVNVALDRLVPEGLIYVESPGELLAADVLEREGLVRVRAGAAGAVRFELLARKESGMASLAKVSKIEKKMKG